MPTPRTHAAILDAAATAFAGNGFAGTRMETVAKRAGCNKALVYRYFVDKKGLFRAVLEARATIDAVPAVAADSPQALLTGAFDAAVANPIDAKLLMQQGLAGEDAETGPARALQLRDLGERLRREQEDGQIAQEFDADYLALAFTALSCFPSAIPHIARAATASDVTSPAFKKKWRQLLSSLAVRLGAR